MRCARWCRRSTPRPVPDFTALPLARREDLGTWSLHLLATHVLIGGATGSGKGSVLWSLVRALAGGSAPGWCGSG